ncbi:MAG TPA: outer membrane beta-barrel domain-containing protein [Vulgatibacter sp.]|nr:outer membrane beta-barrel domain-containing protein [Vulgatibacter sp.]
MRVARSSLRTLASLVAGVLLLCPLSAGADEDAVAEAAADALAASKVAPPTNLDLDERIRPVSGNLFLKKGRHELSPMVGISLGDPFYSKYVAGLQYGYHVGETWMIGLSAGYATSTPSGAVSRCNSSGQDCRTPTKGDLARAPGDFGMIGGLDVSWAPLYGKISVLAESVLHFDTYFLAGAGVVQTRIAPPQGFDVEEKMTPEIHLGVGQRYVLSRYAALRLELRDVLYRLELQGKSGIETSTQNQLLFHVGLSFFLGQGGE